MNARSVLVCLGAGVSSFLLAAVLAIELLAFEFSAVVGLPVGLLAGVVVAVAVLTRYGTAGAPARRVADAVAGFGYTVVLLLLLGYANPLGVRSVLTTDLVVGGGVLVAAVVYVGSWLERVRAVSR